MSLNLHGGRSTARRTPTGQSPCSHPCPPAIFNTYKYYIIYIILIILFPSLSPCAKKETIIFQQGKTSQKNYYNTLNILTNSSQFYVLGLLVLPLIISKHPHSCNLQCQFEDIFFSTNLFNFCPTLFRFSGRCLLSRVGNVLTQGFRLAGSQCVKC